MKKTIPIFKDGDRVAFLGDSLTSCGRWIVNIFETYLSLFPDREVRMYNLGVGGGTCEFASHYIGADLYTYDPTHVFIMFGANDMLHYEGRPVDRIHPFLFDLRRVTDRVIGNGASVSFGIEPKTKSQDQSTVTLRDAAAIAVRTAADDYGAPYLDLYGLMSPFIFSRDDLIGDDLVHFTPLGESVVAKLFLDAQGIDGFSPDRDDFFDPIPISPRGSELLEVTDKLRRIWMAEANILLAVPGATEDTKMNRIKGRIPTRADGAWDDFCYGRALDYVELRPRMNELRARQEELTERMIRERVGK
ncbi:MAG: hypothetical protein IJS78_02220 [Clostridia bacterium]|nr:hypothetical protein [Clostridia bacterium]